MVEIQEMITESSRPFEEQQFLERNKKELRRKTGCHEEIMSEWFRQKRMTVQRLFFNIEVPALPEELANFERISNSYEFENAILAYVIFQIETTENVHGDDFASYLCERELITEELQQMVVVRKKMRSEWRKDRKINELGRIIQLCQRTKWVKKKTVEDYFQSKYGERLAFPNLMAVIVKGRNGSRVNIPAELLDVCPNQKVTNERISVKNQQAELIRDAAAVPEKRMQFTQSAAHAVGINSKNVMNFIKVEEPTTLKGIVLNKPSIKFSAENGKFVIPAMMANWEPADLSHEARRVKIIFLIYVLELFELLF
ncbi:hypothetical protein B9Z55_027896 [Caenorhabditis nigoni]|uniref:PAZ domain-containing protein n=1 Tax=Caenorhabditis nigoni TaxID=1611254 RepID=A0A2G5SDY2_9PELO|nr:hypothetical protein B9Z55_027896 [Caenorhabditis nigoni]